GRPLCRDHAALAAAEPGGRAIRAGPRRPCPAGRRGARLVAPAQGHRGARLIGLIFGPPGSGKGTQAARVEAVFKLSHLSTGDILRAEVARGSEIGKEAERIMRAGDLVPDDLIIRIVQGILRDPDVSSEVLLDGFPRTLEQARALDRMLASEGHKVDFVIAFKVPEDVLVERLLHRAAVEGRADDTREAITERMHEY